MGAVQEFVESNIGAVQDIVASLGLGSHPSLPASSTIRPETLESARFEGSGRGPRPSGPRTMVPRLDELPPLSLAEADAEATSTTDLVVRGRLGEGGMGRVLLGWQRCLAREVAIKTIAPDASEAVADALVREGAIAGALEHPVIPPIHALGRADDGRPLLVMKRIEGVAWTELVEDHAHPAWKSLRTGVGDRLSAHLHVLGRVADAIQFAHDRGVLHRDVKPDNVMIGRDGEVYLVDWGVALPMREAATTTLPSGTPHFMAPEMVQRRPLDARTDVFLLGATLHVVLTGEPRNAGTTLSEVLESALTARRFDYPTTVPAELARLANDATARDPADRPASAREVRRRIDEFLAHRASAAIADAAIARLVELESALAGDNDPSPARLQRLLTEAQFGLAEARRGWPDGPAIADGRARATAIEARIAARDQERNALVDEARDARPDVAASAAGRTLVRFSAACAIITVFAMAWGDRGDPRLPVDREFVALGLGVLAAGTSLAFAYRRTLTENSLVQRGAFAAIALLAAVAAHRALAWSEGASLADALRDDFFITGTAVMAMGLLMIRGWIVGAALCFVAVAAIQWAPEHARTIADVASIVILALVGLLGPRFEPRRIPSSGARPSAAS